MTATVPRSYFDRMYAASTDPWCLATRWYEQRKYACSLAALPRRRYRNGYEPGCSIGVLSEELAARCDRLLCTDHIGVPLREAAERLDTLRHVRIERQEVPGGWPDERFDLVVISELAYYLGTGERARLWECVAKTLEPGGTLLAVHWRQPVDGYPADGDTVHAELARHPAFAGVTHLLDADFRLDVYQPAVSTMHSVAEREGLR